MTDGVVRRCCETEDVYSLRATKKLRDRAKPLIVAEVAEPTTWLGDWYGTVLFWRPQLVLLVNEQTLFPVLMPLAPAATVLDRFPAALSETLATLASSSDSSTLRWLRWVRPSGRRRRIGA